MKLFDDIERTFLGPSSNNETPYNYYNRSARKDVETIRETLENWFLKIPEKDKKEMKASFKKSFDDTFYELFLFSLFDALGFKIEIHPAVPNSTKKPDFLIVKDNLEIYVEAKIAKDKTTQEEAFEKMRNTFYDTINKTKASRFALAIEELSFLSGKQPKAKRIVTFLEDTLSKLNPDSIEELIKTNRLNLPQITYSDEDVYVIFNPIPLSPEAEFDEDKRAIGMFPMETFWGGGEEIIRESFSLKAKRYGELDKPFLICINALSKRTRLRMDVDSAILGSEILPLKSGVFADENGPKRKNVSATMVNQLYLHAIPNSQYLLYENPYAEFPIDFDKLGLQHNYIKKNSIIKSEGNDLDKILKIEKSWLS